MRNICLSIFLIFSVSFSACIDVEEIIESEPGSITATINGESFSVSGLLTDGELNIQGTNIESMAIGGATLPLSGVTEGIALAIVAADGMPLEAGKTYTVSSNTAVAGAEYVQEGANLDLKAIAQENGLGTITITKLDRTEKLVSGTFEFDGIDDDFPNMVYEVRDGKFTDIVFD
ncbi:MAG: DUF6252 family protein [Bacteroidota bacterium]